MRVALFVLGCVVAGCSAPVRVAGWDALSPGEVEAIRVELLERQERDQAVRTIGFDELTEAQRRRAFEDWAEVDTANTGRIKTLVTTYGWPPKSVIGDDASHAAFLLVQHADQDPEFQAYCLPLLEVTAADGEVSRTDLAYLTDRVRVKEGRPQVYGTQYAAEQDENGNVVYLLPVVEDVDGLDRRRAASGMGPWIQYEQRMAELHNRTPADRPTEAGTPGTPD